MDDHPHLFGDDGDEYPDGLYDGRPPRVPGDDTSGAAADSIAGSAQAQRRRVLAFIGACPHGATDDEIEQQLGLRHQSASARRRELVLQGLVVDVDRRTTRSGRWAKVWAVR